MSDLISRQAVIDAVRVGALSTATLYGRTKEGETARKEIEWEIKNIPSVSTENPNKWISVSERLPEVGVDVLMCDMEGTIYLSHRSSYGSFFDEWGNKIKDIRAWMPLPEPYKAESEKKETLREKLEGEERGLG